MYLCTCLHGHQKVQENTQQIKDYDRALSLFILYITILFNFSQLIYIILAFQHFLLDYFFLTRVYFRSEVLIILYSYA